MKIIIKVRDTVSEIDEKIQHAKLIVVMDFLSSLCKDGLLEYEVDNSPSGEETTGSKLARELRKADI